MFRGRGRQSYNAPRRNYNYQQFQPPMPQETYRPRSSPVQMQPEPTVLLTPRGFLEEIMTCLQIEKELDETNLQDFLDPNNDKSFVVCPPQKLSEQDILKMSEVRKTAPTVFVLTDTDNLCLYLKKAQVMMTTREPIAFRNISATQSIQIQKNLIIITWNLRDLSQIYMFNPKFKIFLEHGF